MISLLLLLALVGARGHAKALPRFTGRLEPGLIMTDWRLVLEPSEHQAGSGRPPCEKASSCFAGTLKLGRRVHLRNGAEIPVLLSERADRAPVLYADLNRDGRLDAAESSPMQPTSSAREAWDVVLRFRADPTHGGDFACLFRLIPSEGGPGERILRIGEDVVAVQGFVNVDGRSVLVILPFNLVDDRVELRKGNLGMDGDGDGVIDTSPLSPEYAWADDEEVVFHVGKRFFSLVGADRRQRQLVLQEHPPDDYQRIDLQRGATIPSLTFRSLDARERRPLMAGSSYTLLFFWGLGCAAWYSDVPTVNEALRRFGGAGLSVVAVSDTPDDDTIRKVIKDKGAMWTQAAAADGRALYLKRFRVRHSPTLILVDGQGRIVSRNQEGELPLRGPGLLKTLERLLTPSGPRDKPAP